MKKKREGPLCLLLLYLKNYDWLVYYTPAVIFIIKSFHSGLNSYSRTTMSSRDTTTLYDNARVANFSVLLEDDDERVRNGEIENTVVSTPKKEEPVVAPAAPPVVAPPVDTESSEGWSCVTKNTKKASSNPHKATIRPSGSSPTMKPSFNSRNGGHHQNSHHNNNNNHHHHHHRSKPFIPPLQMDQLNKDQTVEVYDFPSEWRTSDLKRLFAGSEYRLKWHSDNSCWFHFENAEACSKAISGVSLIIKDIIEDLKMKKKNGEDENEKKDEEDKQQQQQQQQASPSQSVAITEEALLMVKVRPFDSKNVITTTSNTSITTATTTPIEQ